MLGKLAHFLRILGYDAIYRYNGTVAKMLFVAAKDNRIILTRSKRVYNMAMGIGVKVCYFSFVDIVKQLQYLQHKSLIKIELNPSNPRCSECNGTLKKVDKAQIINLLPEGTAQQYNDFWQCTSCKRIYWVGQHWEDIRKKLKQASGE